MADKRYLLESAIDLKGLGANSRLKNGCLNLNPLCWSSRSANSSSDPLHAPPTPTSIPRNPRVMASPDSTSKMSEYCILVDTASSTACSTVDGPPTPTDTIAEPELPPAHPDIRPRTERHLYHPPPGHGQSDCPRRRGPAPGRPRGSARRLPLALRPHRGWFGFRNCVSGTYLGHNERKRFIAAVRHHRPHEYFTPLHHPSGGYELLMRHNNEQRSMAVGQDDSSLVEDETATGGDETASKLTPNLILSGDITTHSKRPPFLPVVPLWPKKRSPVISYSQFACIGAGVSAIALGATLKRWYGIDDVRFFERHDKLGGTWHANTYPVPLCRRRPAHHPRELDVPGIESFEGPVMHSAHWREDVDLTGKKVVLFGNGCTASQLIPAIVERTAHLTQIVRTKHWFLPSMDKEVGALHQFLLAHVPGLTRLFRFAVFVAAEKDSTSFSMTKRASKYRAKRQKLAEQYMRETAPEKYHDLLIPNFLLGYCPGGVKTETGVIEADVIVLANGFVTNKPLENIEVRGRNGVSLAEHWDEFGGPEAYNCSVMSGFPNFFICLGPNSATGHTSTIMASENAVNYALRVIKPILDGRASAADVKPEAEKRYVQSLQGALQKTVWYTGCSSWYLRVTPGRKVWNAMTYPWSQAHFWYSRGRQASRATVWWIVGMVAAIGWALSAASEGGMAAGTVSRVRWIVSSPQTDSTALVSKLSSGGS
ncbi:unnamed protein product [Parascedosporium putredinis]|uniref:L-ornithine N(5)-oxygenase n=1 Tax=Parascedosporium putredinis TaxID=1442378 RepID=A0A9P1M721_9PEZI|nr:unnamed protein product [Parascedosporium putredinis]CAI7989596.1 unnamed protein product [Parascedosporium putredinis]